MRSEHVLEPHAEGGGHAASRRIGGTKRRHHLRLEFGVWKRGVELIEGGVGGVVQR